jgi:hypothetical protein
MLNPWVRTVTSTVGRGGHRVGQTIKTLLRPVRTTAALTCAVALDAVRPRSALVAENALLRLQILVLARAAPSRPRLLREDRLLLVLLARVNTAWRDALHLVQPDIRVSVEPSSTVIGCPSIVTSGAGPNPLPVMVSWSPAASIVTLRMVGGARFAPTQHGGS